MKIKTIFGVFVFWLLLFPYGAGVTAATDLNKIVAVVNSSVITQNELDKKITMIKRQSAKSNVAEPKASVLRQQVLDNLIDISLQLQLAKRGGIQVSESELDNIIADIAKNNGITVAKLKEDVLEREGMGFAEFRNQIREQVLISRVQREFLGRDVVVGEKEVEAVLRNHPRVNNALSQYHMVDILLEVPDGASENQQKTTTNMAKKMLAKLQNGAGIEEVVKEGQDNLKEQIVKSNDLGWRKVDEFPALFAKEIVKMDVNQVVGPIKAPNGLHLIKLVERHDSPAQAPKFTKDQAREIAYHRKLTEKLKPWLEEQRAAAYIKITK